MIEKTMEEKYKLLKQPLQAEDVEVRVGTISDKGASLLLYKTARVDTKRFDEIFGGRWKREHYIDGKGSVVCKISIYDTELREWISREDVGSESNTEKEKGAYSDSLKRAGSAWGSGIELYDAPFIFIPCETQKKKDGKGYELASRYFFSEAIVTKFDVKNNNVLVEIKKKNQTLFSNFTNSNTQQVQSEKSVEKKQEPQKPVQAFNYEKLKEELLASATIAEVSIIREKASKNKSKMSTEQQKELGAILTNTLKEIQEIENAS